MLYKRIGSLFKWTTVFLLNFFCTQIQACTTGGCCRVLISKGQISKDGELNEFKAAYVRAVKYTQVKVIPFYLHGMYASLFSRTNTPKISNFGRIFDKKCRVEVVLGSAHKDIDSAMLKSEVEQLRAQVAKAVT